MNDPDYIEEKRRVYEAMCAKLRLPAAQARMLADGLDPEAEIKRLGDQFAALEKADQQVQACDEQLLQKLADTADSTRDLHRSLKQLVAEVERENPLHPALEQARELLEALSEDMPKEDGGG